MSSFHPFEQGQLPGFTAVNVFAVLSTLALTWVAFRIVYLAVTRLLFSRNDGAAEHEPREYVFFHTQLGHYAACLLLGNLSTAVAGLIGLKWLRDRGVTDGPLCTAQGIIMQLGNFTSAYFTIVLAVHTFLTLVLRKRQSLVLFGIFATVGWIGAATIAFSPLYYAETSGPLYGTSGIGCGIRAVYPREQFFFHLFPIFATSVISALLYSLIFLVLRGTLAIRGGLRLNLGPREFDGRMDTGEEYHRFVAAISRSMLWFPIAYIVLLIPYAVARMLTLSGFSVPFEAIAFAFTCWFMLGCVNVLLLYNTFRVLQPAFHPRSTPSNTRDMESFGTGGNFNSFDSKSVMNMNEAGSTLTKAHILAYRYPERAATVSWSENYDRKSTNPALMLLHQANPRPDSGQSGTPSIGLLIPKGDHRHNPSAGSSQPTIDRAISPISELSREIVVEAEPTYPWSKSLRPPPAGPPARLASTDSLSSLPAPPRTVPSPSPSAVSQSMAMNLPPTVETTVDASQTPSPRAEAHAQPLSRRTSYSSVTIEIPAPPRYETYYDASSSSSPTEQEISGWLSKQKSGVKHARDSLSAIHMASASTWTHGPLLSAVASQTSFPSPTLSYYHGPGTPASATSPRPLPPLPRPLYEHRDYEVRDSYSFVSSYGSSGQGGLLGSPPEGRGLAQKPSMTAFGVAQSNRKSHIRQSSGSANSGHFRDPSSSSGRYF